MKEKKPVIGLPSSFDDKGAWEKAYMYMNYLDAVRHFGGIPLIIPVNAVDEELDLLLSLCDGVLLTGGPDIQPGRYGEEVLNDTVQPTPCRDDSEWRLLARLEEKNLPVLGICRGMQLLNVYYGGTLYQDIPSQIKTKVNHAMDRPYIRTCHNCILEKDTPLYKLVGRNSMRVNSHHHQSVKDVAPGFMIMGRCSDGVVEAMWKPDAKFVWCVQWHPERIWTIEKMNAKIWEAFIAACK